MFSVFQKLKWKTWLLLYCLGFKMISCAMVFFPKISESNLRLIPVSNYQLLWKTRLRWGIISSFFLLRLSVSANNWKLKSSQNCFYFFWPPIRTALTIVILPNMISFPWQPICLKIRRWLFLIFLKIHKLNNKDNK